MLRRLELRDVVIVTTLALDFHPGFSVLTGETGAGKSILIDALQLVLGARADAGVVREGAARAEVSAEFDRPPSLAAWLEEAGFDHGEPDAEAPRLLLRRSVDAQGRSRAWINGSPATVTQLREAADHLVDIHGQHAWQGLTRAADARALLDAQAGLDTGPLQALFARRKAAADALARARERQDELARERERLAWQIGELDKLAPSDGEWAELSAEQARLGHAQALIDAAQRALQLASEGAGGGRGHRGDAADAAEPLLARAVSALDEVVAHDPRIAPVIESLHGALAQVQDAAHALNAYLAGAEPEPERLAELDGRMGAWLALARRYRRPPDELPALLAQWRGELQAVDAATDSAALQTAFDAADRDWQVEARRIGRLRQAAAQPLSAAITQAMQGLGMAGGRFAVALQPLPTPQAQGLEAVELQVAGHAGATPRALAKVASGGELSRLALAIAVTTAQAADAAEAAQATDGAATIAPRAGTLIFDEVDAGIGGAVGDIVGAHMKQLGRRRQVLAVTHLAQVAACADHHYVVAKASGHDGRTHSQVQPVAGEARVAEVARMLGGERAAGTSLAHAQAMLQGAQAALQPPDATAPQALADRPADPPTSGRRRTRSRA